MAPVESSLRFLRNQEASQWVSLRSSYSVDDNTARLLAEHVFIHLIIIIKFLSHSYFWLYTLYHLWLSVHDWDGGVMYKKGQKIPFTPVDLITLYMST